MTKANRSTVARQQRHVLSRAENADAYGFFNLLTGPELLTDLESLLPEHRERLFPPTETLSMFMAQALSADGSCRQVVDDAAVKRLIAVMTPCSSNTEACCKARAVQVWISWHYRGGSYDGVVMLGLLLLIAQPRVGRRTGRIEPRQCKRRPKPFGSESFYSRAHLIWNSISSSPSERSCSMVNSARAGT